MWTSSRVEYSISFEVWSADGTVSVVVRSWLFVIVCASFHRFDDDSDTVAPKRFSTKDSTADFLVLREDGRARLG